MKVLAMTLRRAVERGEFIEAHLKELGLDYEIISCVDFQDYSEADFSNLYDRDAVEHNAYMTMGVIGCTLSHLKMFDLMVARNLSHALIMEDDAILPPDIKNMLDLLEPELRQHEVIAISYHNHDDTEIQLSTRESTQLSGQLSLLYPVRLHEIASTMAYVITLSAARKMLEINRPVLFSSDYWGDFYDRGAFASFRCLYPMLVQPAIFRTTIDYPASKTLVSRLARWVRQHEVPLLFPLLNKRSKQKLEAKYRLRLSDEIPDQAMVPAGSFPAKRRH